MGRPKKHIDDKALLQMRAEGKTLKQISEAMRVSIPTLTRRLAVLYHEKGILTKYRQLQGLQLTSLEATLLEAISPEKIESASLIDLLRAFHILYKAEAAIKGKESVRISGLLEHLLLLERIEHE